MSAKLAENIVSADNGVLGQSSSLSPTQPSKPEACVKGSGQPVTAIVSLSKANKEVEDLIKKTP